MYKGVGILPTFFLFRTIRNWVEKKGWGKILQLFLFMEKIKKSVAGDGLEPSTFGA